MISVVNLLEANEEWLIPKIEKEKVQHINPKTGRLKNRKLTKYYKTNIPPEKRTLKNRPRYANGKPIVRFQDWLEFKKVPGAKYNVSKGSDGKYYGWSHRAIAGFYVGQLIKPDMIGNKYEYNEEVNKKYNKIMNEKGMDAADEYRKILANFKPYKIKTEKEAIEHAERFAGDVS